MLQFGARVCRYHFGPRIQGVHAISRACAELAGGMGSRTTASTHRATAVPRPGRRTVRPTGLCLLVACVVLGLLPAGVAAEGPVDVDHAEKALAEASANADSVESHLDRLEVNLASAEESLEELTGQGEALAARLVSTEAQVREYVVSSYVNGGEPPVLALVADVDGFAELSWRDEVLATAAEQRRHDFSLVAELRSAVGTEQAAAASHVESLQSQSIDARNDLIQATAHEREAEDALDLARRQKMLRVAVEQQARAEAERQRALGETRSAASGASGEPSGAVPAPGATGIAGDPTQKELAVLAKIRRCESRGNYSIVSASGKYRGAYQFDRRTWAGVGGSGDPAAAPPYEQDYRALMLYRSRGGGPWPNCS